MHNYDNCPAKTAIQTYLTNRRNDRTQITYDKWKFDNSDSKKYSSD